MNLQITKIKDEQDKEHYVFFNYLEFSTPVMILESANAERLNVKLNGYFNPALNIQPRKAIKDLALLMEKKLKTHDDDFGFDGWKDDHVGIEFLLQRLDEEIAELKEAIDEGEGLKEECADIANFLMMIHELME